MSTRRSSKCKYRRASCVVASDVFNLSMPPCPAPQWASRQNPSGEKKNEDRAFSGSGALFTESGEELTFCIGGVADGHGGHSASELVARAVTEMLTSAMASSVGNVAQAVAETFQHLEEHCLALVDQAGTCVCLCIVGAGKIWCANLGDCRAVLYSWGGDVCLLSNDHRAGAGREYERIVRAGGAVVDDACEGLQPSRSLGDADVKAHCPKDVILAEPELRVFEGEGLVVLGTDGLWDYVSVEDVQGLLPPSGKPRQRSAQDADVLKAIADHLVKVAVDRGCTDDCTAMVLAVLQNPSSS